MSSECGHSERTISRDTCSSFREYDRKHVLLRVIEEVEATQQSLRSEPQHWPTPRPLGGKFCTHLMWTRTRDMSGPVENCRDMLYLNIFILIFKSTLRKQCTTTGQFCLLPVSC